MALKVLILGAGGEVFSDDVIITNGLETPDAQSRDIVRSLFDIVEGNLFPHDIQAIDSAFEKFRGDPDGFTAESMDDMTILMISDIDSALRDLASNEGGIKFLSAAYQTTVNVSDVTMKDCEREGVLKDVRKAFNRVAEHDNEKYRTEGLDIPLIRMPGYKDNLLVKKISNGIIPTALSLPDGRIVLNENFIKVLYKMRKMRLNEDVPGAFYKDMNTELGNFYESVIFSVAIHEIRGHYRYGEGKVIHDPDETRAQKERGRKYREANLLSIMLFWFWVLEDSRRFEKKSLVMDFINENPVLFKDMIEDDFFEDYIDELDFEPYFYIMKDFILKIKRLLGFDMRKRHPSLRRIAVPNDPVPEISNLLDEEGSGKPEIVAQPPLTWQDVINVFDFLWLQEGRAPVTKGRIVMSIYPEDPATDGELAAQEKKVGLAIQALISLKLIEIARTFSKKDATVSEMQYKLVDTVAPKDYYIKETIDGFLAGIESLPDDSPLSEIAAELAAVIKSAAPEAEGTDADRDILWKNAEEAFSLLYKDKSPVTAGALAAEMSSADEALLRKTLNVLVRSGMVRRTEAEGAVLYSARDMGEKQAVKIKEMLAKIVSSGAPADIARVKQDVFDVLAGRRIWKNVLGNIPVLLLMNEAGRALVSEGLEVARAYSPDDADSFFDGLRGKYLTPDATDAHLAAHLAAKHGLDRPSLFFLASRIGVLRKKGRTAGKWFFNAGDVIDYLADIEKEMSSRSGALRPDERALYEKVSSYLASVREELLEVDLHVLENMGILDSGSDVCSYYLASIVTHDQFAGIINSLNPRLLDMPLSGTHYKTMRNFMFRGAWPIAAAVFNSLHLAELETGAPELEGRDLLRNMGTGIDPGARSIFLYALNNLRDLGLVAGFETPESGEAFDRTVFRGLDLDEEGFSEIKDMLDSLAPLASGETDLADVRRKIVLEHMEPNLAGAYYFHHAVREKTLEELQKTVDIEKSAAYVKFLKSIGLIWKRRDNSYDAFGRSGDQPARIKKKLDDMSVLLKDADTATLRTDILEITEPLWAERLLRQFRETKKILDERKKKLSVAGAAEVPSKVLIAVDSDWIPAGQETHIRKLLCASGGQDDVEVVIDTGIALSLAIKKSMSENNIDIRNVITMLDFDTIKDAAFWKRYAIVDKGNHSFVVGINASDLANDTYIRILEMTGMAMHQAFENKVYFHPHISFQRYEDEATGRTFCIYSPQAEKINITEAVRIYEAQRTVLTNV